MVVRCGGKRDDLVRALVDDHRIGNGHALAVDGEDHAVVVGVVVACVDADAARAQVLGRQLPHRDLRVEHAGDVDGDRRRHRDLHQPAITIEQPDVLQQILALLMQRRNRQLVTGRGHQLQREIDPRPDQIGGHGEIGRRRGFFRFSAEGRLRCGRNVDSSDDLRHDLQRQSDDVQSRRSNLSARHTSGGKREHRRHHPCCRPDHSHGRFMAAVWTEAFRTPRARASSASVATPPASHQAPSRAARAERRLRRSW